MRFEEALYDDSSKLTALVDIQVLFRLLGVVDGAITERQALFRHAISGATVRVINAVLGAIEQFRGFLVAFVGRLYMLSIQGIVAGGAALFGHLLLQTAVHDEVGCQGQGEFVQLHFDARLALSALGRRRRAYIRARSTSHIPDLQPSHHIDSHPLLLLSLP